MLQDKLMSDLKEAMKSGDNVRRSVIRLVRAAIQNVEIAEQRILDDGSVCAVIAKEARQRRESIAEFKKGNRQDLVAKEEAELVILLAYLPEQLSREEIVAAARKVIEEIDARGPSDKGKVMPKIIADLKGKAEGREINAVVTELLSGLSG
ncbi:GatB/YqeY domain-containing protein [Chloroflexota bacterium]